MNRVNLGANLISALLYILMGFFGYILYSEVDAKTGGNIINALPEDVFSSVC
jgi:amino acid permease